MATAAADDALPRAQAWRAVAPVMLADEDACLACVPVGLMCFPFAKIHLIPVQGPLWPSNLPGFLSKKRSYF